MPLRALKATPYVRRMHANNDKLRLKTGATGHDEANDTLMRVPSSLTRAPSLSKRHCIVSILARAHSVVLKTSRRKVSSHTYAAECKTHRN
jgi:hypothetical protein